MKKNIFFSFLSLFFVLQCNKKVDSTTIQNKNANNSEETLTYRYIASDKTSANVTFINNDKENKIIIKSNNKTLEAVQTEAWAKGAIYANKDIKIECQGDSIKILQGNIEIGLRKAKGQ